MRKYDRRTIETILLRNRNQNIHLTVFPGRSPVHLYIRVQVTGGNGQRAYSRFTYNGKWSFAAYRRALRVWNSLDPLSRLSLVCEYIPNLILYNGDLFQGRHHPLRKAFMVSVVEPAMPNGRFARYTIREATRIHAGGRVFMYLDPIPEEQTARQKRDLKALCLNNFRLIMGGTDRAIAEGA